MTFEQYRAIIPQGTELNRGPSEDSDTIGVLSQDTDALVIGSLQEGAYPVLLIHESPPLDKQVVYWHQPPESNHK